jgi:hypothetical protein
VTEARIIAVFGALCAALLSTWFGNEIYVLISGSARNSFDPFAIWMAWGIPAAIAAAIATSFLTRKHDWLPARWRFLKLLGSAARCAGLACLLFVPAQIVCMLLFVSVGMTDGGGSGFGAVGDLLLIVFVDAIAIAFGILPAIALQMVVFLLARAMASGVSLEPQSMDQERVES